LIRTGSGGWVRLRLPYFDTMSQVSSRSAGASESSGVDAETIKLLKEEGSRLISCLEDAPSGPVTEEDAAVVHKWLALTKRTVVCHYHGRLLTILMRCSK
jgi:hypothetical protein